MISAAIILSILFAGVHSQSFTLIDKPNGSSTISGGVPLVGNDRNSLSAFGSLTHPTGDFSTGLSLNNYRGLGLSAAHGNHGQSLTGSGTLNLLNTPNHRVNTNAFITRNFPTNQPNHNTFGGGLDYTYRDRFGANLGATHTPFFGRTDLTAGGNYNIFKSPTSSLDVNAGISRIINPQSSFTEPFAGLSFRRFFKRR